MRIRNGGLKDDLFVLTFDSFQLLQWLQDISGQVEIQLLTQTTNDVLQLLHGPLCFPRLSLYMRGPVAALSIRDTEAG